MKHIWDDDEGHYIITMNSRELEQFTRKVAEVMNSLQCAPAMRTCGGAWAIGEEDRDDAVERLGAALEMFNCGQEGGFKPPEKGDVR